MSDAKMLKEQLLQMAADDVQLLFVIISDLGFEGYKVSLGKLKGYSLQQCASKYKVSKRQAQWAYNKCKRKKYDSELKRLFNL